MTRQAPCGPADAARRARLARAYLDLAEQAADGEDDEARNVAAGQGSGTSSVSHSCSVRLAPLRTLVAHPQPVFDGAQGPDMQASGWIVPPAHRADSSLAPLAPSDHMKYGPSVGRACLAVTVTAIKGDQQWLY